MKNGATIERIPIESIIPYAGQPRKYFDDESLRELAESIRENGQITPAWVIPAKKGKYELIAGERRWRACQLAGVTTLLCEIRSGLSDGQRYLASVMENFGRKDCTTMETARSVGAVLKMNGGDWDKTASVFARSTHWVRQYNSLLLLQPEVAALMEPPDPSLNMTAAVCLANLQPEVQVRLTRQLVKAGLRYRAAVRYIRANVDNKDRVVMIGRARKPSDDFELVQRLIVSMGRDTDVVIEMSPERIQRMFATKSKTELAGFYDLLAERSRQFRTIMIRFEKHVLKEA